MSEDCHESNNPRPVVDKSVNLAQQPHDAEDVYDPDKPLTLGDIQSRLRAERERAAAAARAAWAAAMAQVVAEARAARTAEAAADVYDEQEPHTAANQELDDLRRKAMGQCLCGYHEDDHEYPATAPDEKEDR